jgi:hypothetical protein
MIRTLAECAATPTHLDLNCVFVAVAGDRTRQAATDSDLSRQAAVIEFFGAQRSTWRRYLPHCTT